MGLVDKDEGKFLANGGKEDVSGSGWVSVRDTWYRNADVRRFVGASCPAFQGSMSSPKCSLKTGVCSFSVLLGLSSSMKDTEEFGDLLPARNPVVSCF